MKKTYLLFFVLVMFFTRIDIVEGTGVEATYNFGRNTNLLFSIGSLWGDEKISIISPSPFLKVEYSKVGHSPVHFSESQTHISQAFIKMGDKTYPFTVFSGIESRVKQVSLSESMKLGLGLIQNAFVYYQWSGSVGLEYVFTPGLDFIVNFSSSVGFGVGTGGEIMVVPNNVQNINVWRSGLDLLGCSLWLKFFIKKFVIDIAHTYAPAVNRYAFILGKRVGSSGMIRLVCEVERAKNFLFPDKDIFCAEAVLLTLEEKISLSFNGCYERINYKDGYRDEDSEILINVRIPIGVKKDVLRKTDIRFSFDEAIGKDKYLEGKYSYSYSNKYFLFKEKIASAIKNNLTFAEFSRFIKDNITTTEEALWLGSIVGDLSGRWLYDCRGATLEGLKEDIFKDTLRNTATDEQIYGALRDAVLSEQPQPITVCRGISRFMADVINTLGNKDVLGYTARVDVEGGGHVIVPVVTKEQIYLIDYNNIIPTGTRNISTALQIYENLSRCFVLQHYVWDRDNKMLYKIDTPDTLLLKRFFVPGSEIPPTAYLGELLYNIHFNAW